MQKVNLEEALQRILARDRRYRRDVYFFLQEALAFTIKLLEKPVQGPGRHVTGQELLEGIRLFTLREFGPMARTVLRTWGVERTEDFGEIVFNLVGEGVLGKTAEDRREDFHNGYDFDEAFVTPFLPASTAQRVPRRVRPRVPPPAEPTARDAGGTP